MHSQQLFLNDYWYYNHHSLFSILLRVVFQHLKTILSTFFLLKCNCMLLLRVVCSVVAIFIDSSKIFKQFWKPDDSSDDQCLHLHISVRSVYKSDNLNFALDACLCVIQTRNYLGVWVIIKRFTICYLYNTLAYAELYINKRLILSETLF